jgi:hypothetical protein
MQPHHSYHPTASIIVICLFLSALSPIPICSQVVAEPTHLLIGRDNLPANGTSYTDKLFLFEITKGAIRAGELFGSKNWSPDSIGLASIGLGFNTKASGDFGATAIGFNTSATGGSGATAMGSTTIASGEGGATALGFVTTASGDHGATALGSHTVASGDQSFALGSYVSTNNRRGAFFFGDASTTVSRSSGNDNQFACRFVGGYYFITGESGGDQGVRINANGNAWSSICDSTRKENFLPLSGRMVLERIDQIPMRSWNYKGVDPTQDRHYGIMAQEFYHAFGHDEIGTIGNDTLVNPIDMLGIAYAAIKELNTENKALKEQNEQLQQQMQAILKRMDQFEQLVVVKADE